MGIQTFLASEVDIIFPKMWDLKIQKCVIIWNCVRMLHQWMGEDCNVHLSVDF